MKPTPTRPAVTVRAPAKVNLSLRVGPRAEDGYHELATVFHAVGLYDEVTLRPASDFSVEVRGAGADVVPTDGSNLAVRAAQALHELTQGAYDGPAGGPVAITIDKNIPVAAGMAGGSADAAAVLRGYVDLWGITLANADLATLGAELGADVPFGLLGGTALGTGRGDALTSVLARGSYHWVFALAHEGLSTPAVYAEFDRLQVAAGATESAERPLEPPADMLQALRTGDPAVVGALLSNDLQPAALSLQPELADVLDAGAELGALGSVVSGSGPTVAFLAASHEDAIDLSVGLAALGSAPEVVRAAGPVPGARII